MKYEIDLQVALFNKDLYVIWIKNYEFHRLYGPAIEWSDGYKEWYKNDLLHCKYGPAREWPDGDKEWRIDGIYYTEQEFLQISPDCSTM